MVKETHKMLAEVFCVGWNQEGGEKLRLIGPA
jgi:hypothetical protein